MSRRAHLHGMALAFDVMAVRQTRAARLGDDVLFQIFYHLDTDAALCVAALVCRAWTLPAQVLLYNTICYTPCDHSDPADPPFSVARSSASLLARTMHTSPHLTHLVRFLSLSLSLHTGTHAVVREDVEWLHRLPAHGLARFRYTWASEHTFDPHVLVAPAIRTVPHFIAHGPQTPSILRTCLALPALETLEVSLADCADPDPWSEVGVGVNGEGGREGAGGGEWGIDASQAPRLRRLSIRMYFVACPAALALFRAFAPQLVAFQLHALFELFEPHTAWGAALASSSAPWPSSSSDSLLDNGSPNSNPHPHPHPNSSSNLKELVLSGALSWPRAGAPFMDAAVAHHRALERVRCPLGSYTDAFFRALPPSVRVLELYVDVDARVPFAHEGALAALLWAVWESRGHGRGNSTGQREREDTQSAGAQKTNMALEEVRFLSQYRTTLPLSPGSGVVEAARAGGVRLVCVRAALYTPVGCMAEADVVQSSECENRCDSLGICGAGAGADGVGGFSQVSAPTFVIDVRLDVDGARLVRFIRPFASPGSARGWRSYLLSASALDTVVFMANATVRTKPSGDSDREVEPRSSPFRE